jgi:TRAP-type transport system periplasmic protein
MNKQRRKTLQQISGLAGAACLGQVGLARAQAIAMKLSTTASNDLDQEWLVLLKQGVESATGGKIKADVYPASQLGSAQRTIEGVTMGTIEVAINASGFSEGLEPRFGVFSVPGVFDSMAQGAKVLADPAVRARFAGITASKGVEVITMLMHSPVGIVSRKPIQTVADFKGQKIRVPGSAILIEQLKQVGASPIAMSLGEVLPALQNGTIDGVYAGTTIFAALKYYDVAKTMTVLPKTFVVIVGLANTGFLKSLGPLEAVVRQEAKKADAAGATWGEADVQKQQATWTQNGGQIITLGADDAQKYLDAVTPAGLKLLSPEGRQDYDLLRATSAKYR